MKVLAIFLIFILVTPEFTDAEARSRMGRSFGNRGSRSLFNTKKRPTNSFNRKSTNQRNSRSNSLFGNRNSRGGFMKSMMGAVAGTMIGGFLFRALGIGGGMGGAGGGSGILFPILLIAGAAFLYFRYKKQPQYVGHENYAHQGHQEEEEEVIETTFQETNELEISDNRQFISERNKDFFAIQHAWSKKSLDSVKRKMTNEVYDEFQSEINQMNKLGHTSTLENLMINHSEAVASWKEDQSDFITIKFDVSLIEFESDEKGQVVSGKKEGFTDISEFWTFSQSTMDNDWKVCSVESPS